MRAQQAFTCYALKIEPFTSGLAVFKTEAYANLGCLSGTQRRAPSEGKGEPHTEKDQTDRAWLRSIEDLALHGDSLERRRVGIVDRKSRVEPSYRESRIGPQYVGIGRVKPGFGEGAWSCVDRRGPGVADQGFR